MRIFILVWWGQLVSLLGSNLTEFALGVWVLQKTGSITQFALISLCIHLPNLLASPLAGAIVDRWERRRAMILSDSVSGVVEISIMVLAFSNQLEVWHIYIAVAISSLFGAFQWPAYTAAIAQLVPKQKLGRANGMVQVSRATAKILGPVIAGILVEIIGIKGILVVDFGSFLFALVTLSIVRFPQLERTAPRQNSKKSLGIGQLWSEMVSGWNYISVRPGLLMLMMFFMVTYFSEGLLQVLMWPMVLSNSSGVGLGMVLSVAGCGMLLGSIAISAWGGPKRRIYGILLFMFLQGLCLLLGGIRPTVIVAAIVGFGYLFARPIIASCNQTIWQSKVPLHLQGRVFALQNVVEKSLLIVALLSAGPLVERVFEPLMAPDGLLADSVGQLLGVGPGRGIGLLFVLMGMLNILVTAIAYRTPRLRRVEKELPDAIPSSLIASS
ncbi:MAG TPA: MFS transporter [Oscillatoriales cyanobacterium M59_W2019_021]|nr:MAG: MFS transporter [Cyanobacteria bacterium J055]HIK32453.1 MFS transporter [Oscillatoriales cyanobacterium M4454_W2019_049]HIK50433.1 MFS transporter [Oscillatoriales cyanobacterium M59_W2019_021]